MAEHAPLVAHVIYRLGIGGMENGIVNLVNGMPPGRYRHAIICMAGQTDFASRIRRADVALYDLEKKPGKDPGCYLRLFRLLRRLRPDIVHTRNIGTLDCQFVAALAGVACRIHGEHGWEVTDLDGRQRKYLALRRLSRLVVHQYMAVSGDMQDWLGNVIGIPAARITQIYNGIDAERFSPPHAGADRDGARPFVVGTVGRLDPIKDHATLLRAFDLMCRHSADAGDARLVIVGEGEMRGNIEAAIAELGLGERVTLTGASDDVPAMLETFDAFVLPSLNEGISNTILEAMATGLPVIASDVGGNPELVADGSTGRLFPAGDAAALAAHLRAYRDDPSLRQAHGDAGRARVKRDFSPQAMIDNYLGLYDRGLADTRGLCRATG